MKKNEPRRFLQLDEVVHWIFAHNGNNVRMATPLGLGKPNPLLNKIYLSAKSDSNKSLKIFTALSLGLPKGQSDIEKRFLGPFVERIYGSNYPELQYLLDLAKNAVPEHIEIQEFYLQAGGHLRSEHLQAHYASLNYTHVARSLCREGVNVIVQMIASRQVGDEEQFSLSCNPDLTLDLVDAISQAGRKVCVIGVVHPDLPFMEGDAHVPGDFFEAIVSSPENSHTLFSLPRTPIQLQDHWIGFWGSQLLQDNGTLQIGIGSLAEALVSSVLFRHQKNSEYQRITSELWRKPKFNSLLKSNFFTQGGRNLEFGPFTQGLYGTSEMVMDGFMHLRRAGILKREVADVDRNHRRYLHGAFFLGSPEFYQYLRNLSPTERAGIGMTRVSKVNDLYDENELALRRQRQRARFFNTTMQATILGGAASDTLPTGPVVSGVGGQYNFVAMAQELEDSMSVLMLRSQRMQHGRPISNVVTGHPHLTIPRHLRDVFVTEYGIAVTQGASEEQTALAMIQIADVKFQDLLLKWARDGKKIRAHVQLPREAQDNTIENLRRRTKEFGLHHLFQPYPFGSDFTPVEEKLSLALADLKEAAAKKPALLKLFVAGCRSANFKNFLPELQRMKLDCTDSPKNWLLQKLLVGALQARN